MTGKERHVPVITRSTMKQIGPRAIIRMKMQKTKLRETAILRELPKRKRQLSSKFKDYVIGFENRETEI